jgi:hypothetical protein
MEKGGTKHTGVPVKTLKKLLKKAGLKVSGKKATLTRRAKKARLMKGGIGPAPKSKLSFLAQNAEVLSDKAKLEIEEKNRLYNTPEAREERIKAMAKRLYDYAIADLPTQPTTNQYRLSMNNEFLKKHNLLIPEPQTKDVEVLTYYAKGQKELADAFQYMLDKTDYLSKQDLQNQANSSAYWIAKNRAEGYKGEPSKLYLGFRNILTGQGKKKRSRRS